MSKICPNCGNELNDDSKFCRECGARYIEKDGAVEDIETDDTQKQNDIEIEEAEEQVVLKEEKGGEKENIDKIAEKSKTGKRKRTAVIIVALITMMSILGYFVIYPQVTGYMHNKENQQEANRVINLIDSLKDKEITADSESDLDKIEFEYESLSKEQKKLVSNYEDLKKAYEKVESMRQQKIADEIITAIDQINPDSLTAEDTTVQELRDKYNGLSDAQKKLVTNADKLDEYEKIVQSKQDEKEKEDKNWEFVKNLDFYGGMWGDYDTQGNPYREKAKSLIESTISLSDYFSGDVNNVDTEITGFHYQEGQIASADCAVSFGQVSPVDGMYFMVNGLIKLNEEGEFVFVVTYVG